MGWTSRGLRWAARRSHLGSAGRGERRFARVRAAVLCAAAACAVLAGCGPEEPPKIAPVLDVRPVRVLLLDAAACRVRVEGPYAVHDAGGGVYRVGDELAWTEVTAEGGLRIGDSPAVAGPLVLESEALMQIGAGAEGGADRWYSGTIEFSQREGGLRVVNHVDIEAYVAGVVGQEAWPTFHDEALQAQAVAARTYALYIMSERDARPFDLRAGEGDQVYRGVRRDAFGRRAAEAVDATRGVVLSATTPDGLRIFCAYYSAACGGHTQSVADYLGGGTAPAPLSGGVACDYCEIAKGDAYRWGPSQIAKADLLARLKERDADFSDWTGLAAVTVTRTTEFGRIGGVKLAADDGRAVEMGPESFRLAVGSRVMRSTDCTLIDAGDALRFENGKGFGHGLGMCQWGAEGQARAGRRASTILHYYYPGGQIVRAY